MVATLVKTTQIQRVQYKYKINSGKSAVFDANIT